MALSPPPGYSPSFFSGLSPPFECGIWLKLKNVLWPSCNSGWRHYSQCPLNANTEACFQHCALKAKHTIHQQSRKCPRVKMTLNQPTLKTRSKSTLVRIRRIKCFRHTSRLCSKVSQVCLCEPVHTKNVPKGKRVHRGAADFLKSPEIPFFLRG